MFLDENLWALTVSHPCNAGSNSVSSSHWFCTRSTETAVDGCFDPRTCPGTFLRKTPVDWCFWTRTCCAHASVCNAFLDEHHSPCNHPPRINNLYGSIPYHHIYITPTTMASGFKTRISMDCSPRGACWLHRTKTRPLRCTILYAGA